MFAFDVAQLAQKSLIYEASVYPKPGLVTPLDSGSHGDMDYRTFIDSAVALLPCFINCASIGFETCGLAPGEVLAYLRDAGKQGEKEMYRRTLGVNTHKGALFLLGLLCAAAGRLQAWESRLTAQSLAFTASLFVEGIVEREMLPLSMGTTDTAGLTAGERAYLLYGLDGARGEAERGFPTALAALRELEGLAFGPLTFFEKLAHVLIGIMANNGDSNLIKRGGLDALFDVQTCAKKALAAGGMTAPEGRLQIAAMERLLVERSLSPGGSADVLSAALFLWMLQDGSLGAGDFPRNA